MSLIAEWSSLRRFMKTPKSERWAVFYSEGPEYWVHYRPVIEHLTGALDRPVCYVSSSPHDQGLHQDNPRIIPFNIGKGIVRTIFFKVVDHGIVVMTMTDLGNLHIRRSTMLPVHYAYIFHSLVSTHMIYRNRAFEHYDSVLCVGPHQVDEIRETEALYGMPPGSLLNHGYGRIDSLMAASESLPRNRYAKQKRILIAPSWGPNGLYESGIGERLVQALLDSGFHVTCRPHPHTLNRDRACWARLVARFQEHPDFAHEEDVCGEDSLLMADLMVSDWSGAALEFAFGLERPILYIDVPRKINNDEYLRLGRVPLEEALRAELGLILATDQVEMAPDMARILCNESQSYAARAHRWREKSVFNFGRSGIRGAEILVELAERQAVGVNH